MSLGEMVLTACVQSIMSQKDGQRFIDINHVFVISHLLYTTGRQIGFETMIGGIQNDKTALKDG